MDKAQEKIAKYVEDHDILSESIGDRWFIDDGLADFYNLMEELGYRKLPEGEPPLLSEENCHQIDNPFDYNMGAQAQRDSDIKWIRGLP